MNILSTKSMGNTSSVLGSSCDRLYRFRHFWLYKQMSLGTAPEFATYPDHPFPPYLCVAISSFPQELVELTLDGRININLIEMMAPIFELSAKIRAGGEKEREDLRRSKCLAYQLEELFSITDLTQLELLLIAALIDYSITLDTERRQHWLLVGSCQINCARILFTGLEYESSRHNILVWIGALFVACGEYTLQTALLGRKILSRCRREDHFDRSGLLALCRSFIWDEVLTDRLDMAYDFGVVSPHGSESLTASPEYKSACSTISSEPR
jgi:hypothetical protein